MPQFDPMKPDRLGYEADYKALQARLKKQEDRVAAITAQGVGTPATPEKTSQVIAAPAGLGSAAYRNAATGSNAGPAELVSGGDTRLTDARTPTAHAASHLRSGSDIVLSWPVRAITADGAAVAGDYLILVDATAGNVTLTLPAASVLLEYGRLCVKRTDASANTVTVSRAGADLIDGAATKALLLQYDSCSLMNDGTAAWWLL